MKKRYTLACLSLLSSVIPAGSTLSGGLPETSDSAMVAIGLPYAHRKDIVTSLNALLSNEFILYTKTLKYHWNVVGQLFGPLHRLFGEQYALLLEFIDQTAERVRALGFMPYGTLQEFLSHARITDEPDLNPNATTMISNLLEDHQTIIQLIRVAIDQTAQLHDMGTNNFLSDLIEKHEKIAWMLRAHLE